MKPESRRRRCPCRLAAERLEGRLLLSAARAVRGASVWFEGDGATVSQQAGAAEVTIVRARSPRSPEARRPLEVEFHTAEAPGDGLAVAGTHYVPVHQTIRFAPGEASKTVAVPLIPGVEYAGPVALGLSARPVVAGGQAVDATIAVVARADVTPPRITGSRLLARGDLVTGVELTFSEPMDAARVENPSAYLIQNARDRSGLLGWAVPILMLADNKSTTRYPVQAARYDPATRTVTLELPRVKAEGTFQVSSPRLNTNPGTPADPRALLDASGNVLNGETTGGNFQIQVGRGQAVRPSLARARRLR